ncbi:MAG TPA: ATP-binding protein [Spirochaetota bacterium]|nr:ATP-binding protein [Spirochaetota bacterium]HOR44274.1 ATP-binding protein [Spirochaetota bacterium]HPK55754.1 ATP-binding protein [Spirochaetota bacterium]
MQYSVSDFLTDIVQNSIEAEASVITVDYIEEFPMLNIMVGDNGKGMDEETLAKAKDPFFTDGEKHKNRKVGLGIPFLIQAVEAAGGEFDIKSDVEMGTAIEFSFNLENVDCPTEGDLASAFRSLLLFSGDYEILINRIKNGKSYRVTKSELKEALGDLESADSLNLAKAYFESHENELSGKGE